MSREIKFRLWSTIYNKFIINNNENVDFVINTAGNLYSIEHSYCEKCILTQTCTEIMQYTGLKDDKGKEIYEGDILLSSNENGTFLQLIGFGDSDREYDSILKGFKIINGYTLENDDYEIIECKPLTQELVKKYDIPVIEKENIIMDGWWVIGNKWENPELMKLLEAKDDKKR